MLYNEAQGHKTTHIQQRQGFWCSYSYNKKFLYSKEIGLGSKKMKRNYS